jgi:hypothetical protein
MRPILALAVPVLAVGAAAVFACGSPEASHATIPTATIGSVAPPPPPDASAPEPVAGACGGRCSGRVGPALVDALGVRVKQAHRCYDNALAIDKTVRGKVSVRMKIGADGRVCDVTARSDNTSMVDVAKCVAAFYRANTGQLSFPLPDNGCVDVDLPINFVPRPDDAGAP